MAIATAIQVDAAIQLEKDVLGRAIGAGGKQ
jgi:hypothetical protein